MNLDIFMHLKEWEEKEVSSVEDYFYNHLFKQGHFKGKFNSGQEKGYGDMKMGNFQAGAHMGDQMDQKPNINSNGQLQFTDSSVLTHLQL